MTGTILVLFIVLIIHLLAFISLVVIASMLAKRSGQQIKMVSWSPTHGFTAEFHENSERNN